MIRIAFLKNFMIIYAQFLQFLLAVIISSVDCFETFVLKMSCVEWDVELYSLPTFAVKLD